MNDRVPVEALASHPARILICYPECEEDVLFKRINELEKLGVIALILRGRHRLGNLRFLGKGTTGIVVEAELNSGRAALKTLRTDADRLSMSEEARLLASANTVGVGPRLLGWTVNFLLMELVEGPYLRDKLKDLPPNELRQVLVDLLTQARKLDRAKVDHGELVRLRRHIILRNEKPIIIDFESASTNRRPSNVTTVTQSIFLNNSVAGVVSRLIGEPDKDVLLRSLQEYRQHMDDASFTSILSAAGL